MSEIYEEKMIDEVTNTNVENIEEVENAEESNQQMQEDSQLSEEAEEEDIQQKQVDEKIKKQLEDINSQFHQILQKIQIHKNILQEISDASDQEKLKQKAQLKFNKKSFQENEIKLEKLLLSLDSLVGASEELRPVKKSTVVEIQKTINLIESSILPQIKKLEENIEEIQKRTSFPPEEETKEVENLVPCQQKEELEESKEKMNEEPIDKKNEEILQENQQKVEEKREVDESEEEEDQSFPFPSKKEWESLTFEPKFNIQQHPTKYLLSSKIPGLNNEDIKIKTCENVLSIEAVRYPSEQEKNLLIKKLFETVRNPHVLRRLTRNQIVSAILRIASEYNFGKFSAKYELPHNFDASTGVNALYNNGVLQIELPIKIKTQHRSPFYQNNSNNFYRPEVPFYGQRSRRPNNFWDFF